jgi:hypothetical protein
MKVAVVVLVSVIISTIHVDFKQATAIAQTQNVAPSNAPRLIIIRENIRIRNARRDWHNAFTEALAAGLGGIVVKYPYNLIFSEESLFYGTQRSGSVTVKIPSTHSDYVLCNIKTLVLENNPKTGDLRPRYGWYKKSITKKEARFWWYLKQPGMFQESGVKMNVNLYLLGIHKDDLSKAKVDPSEKIPAARRFGTGENLCRSPAKSPVKGATKVEAPLFRIFDMNIGKEDDDSIENASSDPDTVQIVNTALKADLQRMKEEIDAMEAELKQNAK